MKREDNELLTRVENGAPLGEMIRHHHWIPAIRAGRLEADGAPVRVRLLGENFVAFRATDGRVGFLDEACPHRGVSLALARNEDCALTCIFHGVKIDVSGKVVDVPTAGPHAAEVAAKMPVRHYPVREAGGLVWVWLGKAAPGRFPDLPFTHLPDSHVFVASTKIPVNYLQGLEATLDSSHIGFLHRDWIPVMGGPYTAAGEDLAPTFEIEDTAYGFRAAALRRVAAGTDVRTNEFVMPFHSSTAPGPAHEGTYQILVPIDDVNTLWILVRWNDERAFDVKSTVTAKPGADQDNWVPPLGGPDDYWGQDRASMKNGSYAGFSDGLLTEDTVVQISMGAIVDRTKEYLLPSDRAIIRTRSQLLQATRDHLAGQPPFGTDPAISYANLMGVAAVLPAGVNWKTLFPDHREAAE